MEIQEYSSSDQGHQFSFPRGGPIYGPDVIGPLTTAVDFESAAREELQCLEAELRSVSVVEFEGELLVDELKIFTDEDLVEKAIKEAFKDADQGQDENPSQHQETRADHHQMPDNGIECSGECGDAIKLCESLPYDGAYNGSQSGKYKKPSSKMKKGRSFDRDCRAAELDGSYLKKVEEFAKIKKKQDADKKAARLCSFNGSIKTVGLPVSFLERAERMRALKSLTYETKAKLSSTSDYVPVEYPDVILTIEIYHSRKYNLKIQEFLVLGRQPLTELRDNIHCITDELMRKAEQDDPSGYFLIEEVFYNDRRSASSIDYSDPIFRWLKSHKDEALEKWGYTVISAELGKKQKSLLGNETISQLPNFKALEMCKARFCDLKFRIGCGYLYCHQGNCRHIIVIRDMRLVHPDDVQNMAAYPILAFQHRPRYRKCSICQIYLAKKVTVDDKWAQKNPSFFCDNCYFLLHYSEDGSLLYNDFIVYDYHHE